MSLLKGKEMILIDCTDISGKAGMDRVISSGSLDSVMLNKLTLE